MSKHTMSVFKRILLSLLAVFYISVFAVEATHGHDNLIESTRSSDNSDNGLSSDNCHVCAYFGHHEIKEIVFVAILFFALISFQETPSNFIELNKNYQTYLRYFVNRGPPCNLM